MSCTQIAFHEWTPPPRVINEACYWTSPPPATSERCRWWIERIHRGWRRNRRLHAFGWHDSADYFGVYIWEWINVLSPLLAARGA